MRVAQPDHGAVELLALVRGDLLRVVQDRERPHPMIPQAVEVEEHAGDHERAGERASTCLVRAGHEAHPEPAIEAEEALTGRHRHAAEHSAGRRTEP